MIVFLMRGHWITKVKDLKREEILKLVRKSDVREASRAVESLTGGVISPVSVHRLIGRVVDQALEKEKEDWEACFERGEAPKSENKEVDFLFIEAEGTWVSLQGEEKSKYELKNGIAYEGWRRLNQEEERYALVGKRYYCHSEGEISFWEGASLEWSRKWDLSQVKKVVIGGDGVSK